MATDDFTSNDDLKAPIFKEFKWHREDIEEAAIKGNTYAQLAGMVKDISSGCHTILEIIEYDSMQPAFGEKPLLHPYQISNLARLAIQSLVLLEKEADDGLDWIHKYKTKSGIASRNGEVD